MIYVVIICVILIQIYVFDFKQSKRYKKFNYNLVLLVLILLAGLRYRVGLDTIGYMRDYAIIPTINQLTFSMIKGASYDPLYFILSSFAKTISSDFVIMQFIQAIIVNCCVFYFIRKNTQYIFSAVLFYCIFGYFNFNYEVMREAIAVSFFLLSFDFLIKKKYIKYYLFATLAFLSHSSAIVLFILPLFVNLKINRFLLLYLILSIIAVSLIATHFNDLLKIISLTDRISNKANLYSDDLLTGKAVNFNGMIGFIMSYIIYPLICFFILRKIDNTYYCNYQFPLILIMFIVILLSQVALFYRFLNYFILFDILLFAEFSGKVYNYIQTRIRWLSGTIILSMFFFALVSLYFYGFIFVSHKGGYSDYNRYFPYESILTRKIDNDRERMFLYYDMGF